MVAATEENSPVLLDRARERLQETFGYTSFRDGQEQAIEAVLAGHDTLVIMPTGSGKSLCYQVPALVLPGLTVVVSPLIALMKDQVDALSLRGVPVTFINSSIGADEQWSRLAGLERGDYKLVYIAPERFRSRAFRAALARTHISLLAIDEAHCISQWGHDFRPDYRKLKDVRKSLAGVPAIALTATATPEVREDIARELEMTDGERIVTGFDRPNLHIEVRRVRGKAQKKEFLSDLFRDLERRAEDVGFPAGIVYTGTRKNAEEVAQELGEGRGRVSCRAYHAGLEAEARRVAQEDFMEGRLPWVAATNAFGMGVDKSDIRFVVHYDLPGSIEAYYQEIGRGGRDGLPCRCLLLFSEADRRLQEFFIEGSNPDRATIESVQRFLHDLGENPIFRTLVDLESLFRASGLAQKENPLVFRSSVSILERAGALERLDHFENLAEITASKLPWPSNPYPERAPVKHALYASLGRVFARIGDEPAQVSLERWAQELDISEDSLRRGLSLLEEEGHITYVPPFRGRAIRLPARMTVLDETGFDFEALKRRRLNDEKRLDDLLQLARAAGCRRDAILRYFGETVPEQGCGHCDFCTARQGTQPELRDLTDEELIAARKALSGIARARGRCGRGRVIGMLRGSKSQEVTSLGLANLSTYGILRDWSREELYDLLQSLEADGCLRQTNDKFPVVSLTERGVRVMKGEERPRLALACTEKTPVATRGKAPPQASPREDEFTNYDTELFENLRQLRRTIAEELGVPAYRVFNDRTLRGMAFIVPRTEADLLLVPGVGAVTLARFGQRFLAALRTHGGE